MTSILQKTVVLMTMGYTTLAVSLSTERNLNQVIAQADYTFRTPQPENVHDLNKHGSEELVEVTNEMNVLSEITRPQTQNLAQVEENGEFFGMLSEFLATHQDFATDNHLHYWKH